MRGNRETAAFMNHFADLACRFSFKIGERLADAEKMAICCSHFHTGQDQETIDRKAVESHQTLVEQVTDSVARVVISNRDAVQTFRRGGGDHVFRAGYTVPGKERMGVQVDIKRPFQRLIWSRRNGKHLTRYNHCAVRRKWTRR